MADHEHRFIIQQRGEKIVKRCLGCTYREVLARQPKGVATN